LVEELDLRVEVRGHLWTSQTRWGTRLEWLYCERLEGSEPRPNFQEVEEFHWMSVPLLEARKDLLGSMPEFLASFRSGDFRSHFESD
jgi:hypothetical protein